MYALLLDVLAKKESLGDEAWNALSDEFDFKELEADYDAKDPGEAGRLVQAQFRANAASPNPTPLASAFVGKELAKLADARATMAQLRATAASPNPTPLASAFVDKILAGGAKGCT